MSDPDSVQIKAALLDQIREYEGCFEWPEDLGSGTVPDVPAAGIVGTPPFFDAGGYPDDYAFEDFDLSVRFHLSLIYAKSALPTE